MIKKIVVIEDNPEIRENTAELLMLSSYDVLTAENGSIGFELVKKFKPDLILCDMMMPETDGQAFLKLAKEDDFVRTIPLVFFSAGSPSLEIRRKLIKEADGYLRKPFSEQELLKTIKSVR